MISFQYGFQNSLSLYSLPCLLLAVLFLIPPQSIHAPDLLQTIRNLWTLTLLMLLSVEIKITNIKVSYLDLGTQILPNYAKTLLLSISSFCFM